MKKKVTWNKNGAFTFAGFARDAKTREQVLLYWDARLGLLATPFKDTDEFPQAGMPRNRRFDMAEELVRANHVIPEGDCRHGARDHYV